MVRPLKHYSSILKSNSKTKKLKYVRKINSLRKLSSASRRYRTAMDLLLSEGLYITKYYDLRQLNRLDLRSLHTKKIKDKATSGYFGIQRFKK